MRFNIYSEMDQATSRHHVLAAFSWRRMRKVLVLSTSVVISWVLHKQMQLSQLGQGKYDVQGKVTSQTMPASEAQAELFRGRALNSDAGHGPLGTGFSFVPPLRFPSLANRRRHQQRWELGHFTMYFWSSLDASILHVNWTCIIPLLPYTSSPSNSILKRQKHSRRCSF
jgi:hypothetical protein